MNCERRKNIICVDGPIAGRAFFEIAGKIRIPDQYWFGTWEYSDTGDVLDNGLNVYRVSGVPEGPPSLDEFPVVGMHKGICGMPAFYSKRIYCEHDLLQHHDFIRPNGVGFVEGELLICGSCRENIWPLSEHIDLLTQEEWLRYLNQLRFIR